MVKTIIRLAGYLFTIICLLFFVVQVKTHWKDLLLLQSKGEVLLYTVPSASVFYALICFLLSFSWYCLSKGVGGTLTFPRAHRVYAKSQIAKYIPGNIFHYGSRQVLGHKVGMAHSSLLLANLLEALVIVGAAAGISAAGRVSFIGHNWGILPMIVVLVVSVAASFAVVVLLPKLAPQVPGMRGISEAMDPSYPSLSERSKHLALSMASYLIFFALMGLLLWILAMVYLPGTVTMHNLLLFLSVYAAAWVVGFITPGASGGMGVREALLSAGLSPVVGVSGALALALVLRLVTILGDGLFYLTSYFVRDWGPNEPPAQSN